jgi:hypothetical protein
MSRSFYKHTTKLRRGLRNLDREADSERALKVAGWAFYKDFFDHFAFGTQNFDNEEA